MIAAVVAESAETTTFCDQSISFYALAMKTFHLLIPWLQIRAHLDAVHDITMSELFKWCRAISCMIGTATIGRDSMKCNRSSRHTSMLRSTSWTHKYAKNATKYWALRKLISAPSVIIHVINTALLLIRWVILMIYRWWVGDTLKLFIEAVTHLTYWIKFMRFGVCPLMASQALARVWKRNYSLH